MASETMQETRQTSTTNVPDQEESACSPSANAQMVEDEVESRTVRRPKRLCDCCQNCALEWADGGGSPTRSDSDFGDGYSTLSSRYGSPKNPIFLELDRKGPVDEPHVPIPDHEFRSASKSQVPFQARAPPPALPRTIRQLQEELERERKKRLEAEKKLQELRESTQTEMRGLRDRAQREKNWRTKETAQYESITQNMRAESAFRIELSKLYRELKQAQTALDAEWKKVDDETFASMDDSIGVRTQRKAVKSLEEEIDELENDRLKIWWEFVTDLEGLEEGEKEEMRLHRASKVRASRKVTTTKENDSEADGLETWS